MPDLPSPTAQARHARLRNLVWFRSPRLWKTWPFLAVVRSLPDGGRQCGVLFDAKNVSGTYGFSATVFLANLFQLPRTPAELFALPRIVYDTWEELAGDGWTVD